MTYKPMGRSQAIEEAAATVRRLTDKDFAGLGRAIEVRYRSKGNWTVADSVVRKKGGSGR